MEAERYGNVGMVKLLLEHGANLNSIGPFGETVLIIAVSDGYGEIIELLIQKGADPHLKDNNGNTALMIAKQTGNDYLLDILRIASGRQP